MRGWEGNFSFKYAGDDRSFFQVTLSCILSPLAVSCFDFVLLWYNVPVLSKFHPANRCLPLLLHTVYIVHNA